MTAKYQIRFFFDPGSGICFWSANDVTRKEFGYAIDLMQLPISDSVRTLAEELIDQFDTSVDWTNPANNSPWTESEKLTFENSAHSLLCLVQQELGDEFEIFGSRSQAGPSTEDGD